MSMSKRVARLRQQSLDAVPSISSERAELMTEFYKQDMGPLSAPVRRALAFQYLMEHKTICRRRKRSCPQSCADLPRTVLPYPGRSGHPQFPRKDILCRHSSSPAGLRGNHYPLLAGEDHARTHLSGNDGGVEGCL
jgi:hypothetical protein